MSRLNYLELSKPAIRKIYELGAVSRDSAIETKLAELVKIRASQLNGCAFCVDMHVKEATLHGERPLRLHHIAIFQESPLFSEREKMGLRWTEALTRIPEEGISDELYQEARLVFSERELSDLTVIVATINLWNRLNVAFRTTPGSADAALGLLGSGLE